MKARAPLILFALLASFLVPIMIGNVYATSGCTSGCQATVTSNVPASDGTIWVQIYNGTGPGCSSSPCTVPLNPNSPPTYTFANDTTLTIQVLNTTFTGQSTQGHYVWKEWANYYGTSSQFVRTASQTLIIHQILYNYTGTAAFTAVFDKQYSATLSFTDVAGNPLNPAPTNLTLQGPTVGSEIISSYSGQYVSADNYTVISAYWEGTKISPTTNAETVNLANGPVTTTLSLRAYPATILIVDNNNNPVQGASVTVTFGNSTTSTYTSDSKGLVNLGDVPEGSFGATVHYQNQAYGPYSLTAVNNPTNTITVNGGTSTNTTTTAIVLLAIFGIAFFLVLLAIRVRKPAAPPRID